VVAVFVAWLAAWLYTEWSNASNVISSDGAVGGVSGVNAADPASIPPDHVF